MKKVNYHIHSNYSDGAFSIEQIVKYLKDNNVYAFSITDHNTVDGNFLASQLAKENGIKYINGIELSCCFNKEDGFNSASICHILGYNIDIKLMQKELLKINNFKTSAMIKLGEKLNSNGYDVPLCSSKIKYAEELNNLKYFDNILDSFYYLLNDEDYLKVSRCLPYINEGIELIHKCGGIAVWAHPYEIINGKKQKLPYETVEKLAKTFKTYGLDGLETYYVYFSSEEINNLVNLANSLNLLKSIGTDFHGKAKMHTEVRSLAYFENENIDVDENISSLFFPN